MIEISDKSLCCGCTACAQICPKHCITMLPDEEGFLYPHVDTSLCIDCGLCEKVCPITGHNVQLYPPLNVFAGKNHNDEVRKSSSSGGAFSLLATKFIKEGGVVCGCAWDDNCIARHIIISDLQDLQKLQSSKYVQSSLDNIFASVKQLLKNKQRVLFSGTPCQIAGLKSYLNKSYDNLFTIDLLCHGVPSPALFESYKELMSKRFGSRVVWANCRNKDKSWKRLSMELKFANGKRYTKLCQYDPYLALFLSNKSLRPICYSCKFACSNRVGDISVGDFWGLGKIHYDYDDDKGISMLLLNTDKGVQLFDLVKEKMDYMQKDLSTAIAGNKVLCQPTHMHVDRKDFYQTFINDGFEEASQRYASLPSYPKQVYLDFMRWGLDLIRKIFKKGW